jgi:hypothetical protein
MVLRKIALSNDQVGTGLSRSRLSSPISRRFTSVWARTVKQAAMIA